MSSNLQELRALFQRQESAVSDAVTAYFADLLKRRAALNQSHTTGHKFGWRMTMSYSY